MHSNFAPNSSSSRDRQETNRENLALLCTICFEGYRSGREVIELAQWGLCHRTGLRNSHPMTHLWVCLLTLCAELSHLGSLMSSEDMASIAHVIITFACVESDGSHSWFLLLATGVWSMLSWFVTPEIKWKHNGGWVKSGNAAIFKPTVCDHHCGYRLTARMLHFHRPMLPFVIVMLNTALGTGEIELKELSCSGLVLIIFISLIRNTLRSHQQWVREPPNLSAASHFLSTPSQTAAAGFGHLCQ